MNNSKKNKQINTAHNKNALFDGTRLLDYKNELNKEKKSIY